MADFFKPLRRKIGVLALMMACVFMVGWFRSRTRFEYIFVPFGNVAYGICSMHGGLDFIRQTALDKTLALTSIDYKSVELHIDPDDPFNGTPWSKDQQIDWRWDWWGFHLGDARYGNQRRDQDYMIPYWAIVIPLTAISACLLIGTPRAEKKPVSRG